jgi:hypothetical protein
MVLYNYRQKVLKILVPFSETRKLLWKAETKLDTKNLEYLKKLAEEEKKIKVNRFLNEISNLGEENVTAGIEKLSVEALLIIKSHNFLTIANCL